MMAYGFRVDRHVTRKPGKLKLKSRPPLRSTIQRGAMTRNRVLTRNRVPPPYNYIQLSSRRVCCNRVINFLHDLTLLKFSVERMGNSSNNYYLISAVKDYGCYILGKVLQSERNDFFNSHLLKCTGIDKCHYFFHKLTMMKMQGMSHYAHLFSFISTEGVNVFSIFLRYQFVY